MEPIPGKEALQAGFLAGLAVALSKALFAYDAWYTVTFVAEEVHDSHRTLPRALLLGCLLVTVLYVLTNVAYLAVLPIGQIAAVPGEPGGGAGGHGALRPHRLDAGDRRHPGLHVWLPERPDPGRGPGMLRHGPRRALLPQLRRSARRGRTPMVALLFQGVWSMVLALTGSYSELLTYSTFASVFFGGLTVAAVYRLRFTAARPAASVSLLGLSAHARAVPGDLPGFPDLRRPRRPQGDGDRPAAGTQQDPFLSVCVCPPRQSIVRVEARDPPRSIYMPHGSRMARASRRLASSSCGNRSACGSQRSLRPNSMAMLPRWATVQQRWPISAGKYGSRALEESKKSRCSPPGQVCTPLRYDRYFN